MFATSTRAPHIAGNKTAESSVLPPARPKRAAQATKLPQPEAQGRVSCAVARQQARGGQTPWSHAVTMASSRRRWRSCRRRRPACATLRHTACAAGRGQAAATNSSSANSGAAVMPENRCHGGRQGQWLERSQLSSSPCYGLCASRLLLRRLSADSRRRGGAGARPFPGLLVASVVQAIREPSGKPHCSISAALPHLLLVEWTQGRT